MQKLALTMLFHLVLCFTILGQEPQSTTSDSVLSENKAENYIKKAESLPKTTASWDQEVFSFEEMKEGEQAMHHFLVTNTGKNDLQITNVKSFCDCMVVDWTKEAVKPGEEGFVQVTFNSEGKSGDLNKMLMVTGNFERNINKKLNVIAKIIANEKTEVVEKEEVEKDEVEKEEVINYENRIQDLLGKWVITTLEIDEEKASKDEKKSFESNKEILVNEKSAFEFLAQGKAISSQGNAKKGMSINYTVKGNRLILKFPKENIETEMFIRSLTESQLKISFVNQDDVNASILVYSKVKK